MFVVFLIGFIACMLWYLSPHNVNKTFVGVLYQLGIENAHNAEQVTIEVHGKIQRHLFRPMSFKGRIRINDELLPPRGSFEDELTINLGKDHYGGPIHYFNREEMRIYSYGSLFFNKNFSQLTIVKYEMRKNGENTSYGWNSENGWMIAAPAADRTEALQISNAFMSRSIPNPLE